MADPKCCAVDDCDRPSRAAALCSMHYKRLRRTGATALRTAPERFWDSLRQGEGCWDWQGARLPTGYGLFKWAEGGRTVRMVAHRYSYILANGPIPTHMMVDHLCYNPACVRPDHLRLATARENAENRRGAQANSAIGVRGVEKLPSGKYRAVVYSAGTRSSMPARRTLAEAERDAQEMRARLHTPIPLVA